MQMVHWSTPRRTSAGLAALLLPLIAGCALSGPAAGASQTGTPTASATTTATMTVTLRPGQTHAGVTDTLTVTVVNGLPAAIQVEDHLSDCTIVTLERQEGSSWQAVALCHVETPTRLLSIPPGATQIVILSLLVAPSREHGRRVRTSSPWATLPLPRGKRAQPPLPRRGPRSRRRSSSGSQGTHHARRSPATLLSKQPPVVIASETWGAAHRP
jgi:hypothetical protein